MFPLGGEVLDLLPSEGRLVSDQILQDEVWFVIIATDIETHLILATQGLKRVKKGVGFRGHRHSSLLEPGLRRGRQREYTSLTPD
jgi:hypothetical protein